MQTLPLVTRSYIIHVLLHEAFIFEANQVFISTVLCCIICSMLNCFFSNGTYLIQDTVYHKNGNQGLKLLAAMATGGVTDPFTHLLTLIHTCKERFHIIMKCVTYNHTKLPGQ